MTDTRWVLPRLFTGSKHKELSFFTLNKTLSLMTKVSRVQTAINDYLLASRYHAEVLIFAH